MANEEKIDWTQMMNLLHVTNLEKGLVEQYKNASNLDIRIGLHQNIHKIHSHGLTGFTSS